MDRTKLKELLKPFQVRCAEKGKPLIDLCIEDAYPGDISTSYIVQVKANWVNQINCFEALDFLFDILWETTNEETRKKYFLLMCLIAVPNCIVLQKLCLQLKHNIKKELWF